MISAAVSSRSLTDCMGHSESLVIHSDIHLISVSGNSGTGKNFLVKALQGLSPGTALIKSCTTRESRGPGQDEEYEFLTDREFNTLLFNGHFLWSVKGQRRPKNAGHDRYATRRADLERAILQEVPSIMHLVHDKVPDLEQFMRERDKRVLKLLVVCDCKETVRQRIINRSNIPSEEVEDRVAGFYQNQLRYRQSGLYNGVIVSSNDKTIEQLQEELAQYLTRPIPEPRTF